MALVKSEVLWDQPQRDGRRHVRERHTDHLGVAHLRDYLAAVGVDVVSAAASYAPILDALLVQTEIAGNISRVLQDGDRA